MCNKKCSRVFIEGLIDSFLTEEIIPDILIDVFSGQKFLVSIMTQTFVISFLDFIHHTRIETFSSISLILSKNVSLVCLLYLLQDRSGHQEISIYCSLFSVFNSVINSFVSVFFNDSQSKIQDTK